MRLPTRVHLPFGYIVLVKVVSDAEMRNLCEEGEALDGLWDASTRTIYIRRSLPERRRKYLLSHEMGHALWDWQHAMMDEGAMAP
jgi:Zn-dependent peptidase ImmA (M78 family)